MGIQRNSSNINKTFIIGDQGLGTGHCTTEYANLISPCTGDTVEIIGNLSVNDSLSATTFYGNGSNISGIDHNTVVSGLQGGVSNQYYHLTEAEYSTISGSGADNRYVNITGDTMTGGLVTPTLSATTISATTYVGLPTDINITGGTYNAGTATFTNNTGGTFNVTGFTVDDLYVTGGTYSNGTATFMNNTGGTFNVSGFKTDDLVVTGGTYSDGIATFTNNTGGTFTVTGLTTPFTGGTIAGGLVAPSISATSITATTLYGDGSNITNINPSSVTGFVHLSGDTMTGTLIIPTLSATSIDISNEIINSSTGDVLINNNLKITGDLVVLGTTITANTEQLLIKDNTLTLNYGETGGTVTKGVSGLEVDRGTGATYTMLFVESAQTFNVGISGNTQPVATREESPLANGIAYWNSSEYRFDTTLNLSATTISATTYIGLPSDIYTTGGTYNAGTATFTNNIGGTFTVTGLTTPFTGGTISGDLVAPSVSATTITATTLYGDGSNITNINPSSVTGFVHLSGDTMTGGLVTPSLSATSISADTGFIGKYLDFRTGTTDPTPVAGRVYFDESENALSYYPNTPLMDITINLAQEGVIYVYNSGSTILNGQACHITGSYNGVALIELANSVNNGLLDSRLVSGVATHDIQTDTYGFITFYGKVRDLTLTGITEGSEIYLSDTIPGGFIYDLNTLELSSRVCRIGHVLQTGATNGIIQVEIDNETVITELSQRQNEILTRNSSSTGLISGGTLSLSAATGSTTFNVSAGKGHISNNSNPLSPTFSIINWSDSTGVSTTYISDTGETHTIITINSSGNIIQTKGSVGLTAQQKRQEIEIGGILHIGGQILYTWERTIPLINPINQLEDLTTSIGPFSVSGNRVSKITGTLSLEKSLGEAFYFGGNYGSDVENPNILTTNILSGSTLVYATGTKILGPIGTTIDTTNYDPYGGGTIIPLDNNQFTAHRIWHQPTENVLVFQYGQTQFAHLFDARANFSSENYITPSVLPKECYLVAVILVKKGESNLDSSTTSLIVPQGKFAGTGGGGTNPDTLQTAYENSVTPEIVTDTTRGAVDFKIGSASNNDSLVNFRDSSNNLNAYIIGTGGGIFNSLTATTLSGSGTRDVKVNSVGALIGSTDKQTSTNITGTTVLDTFPDTDTDACVWDYMVKSNSGMRAGTITGVWSASTDVTEYYEISSNDIGNTEGVMLNVDISSNNVRLNVNVTGGTWTIKTNRTQL